MDKPCIYTDYCSTNMVKRINYELGLDVIKTIPSNKWNLNDAMRMVTIPTITLTVFNIIDETTIIESGLLSFLCRPILITDKDINDYPVLKTIISHHDPKSDLRLEDSRFIEWYNKNIRM